mgnify:CR=1 FL=1
MQDDLLDVSERQQLSQLAAPPPHPTPSGRGLVDVFGNQVPPIALDQVSCPNCGRKVAAGRCAGFALRDHDAWRAGTAS